MRIERDFHFATGAQSKKKVSAGKPPRKIRGRVPRVAKLMAVAIRFEAMLRDGVVSDQAELARLGHVTRARLTQVMNLLNLAPDIQEALLFLPRVESGADPICERRLRTIAGEVDWGRQRESWIQCRNCVQTNGKSIETQ